MSSIRNKIRSLKTRPEITVVGAHATSSINDAGSTTPRSTSPPESPPAYASVVTEETQMRQRGVSQPPTLLLRQMELLESTTSGGTTFWYVSSFGDTPTEVPDGAAGGPPPVPRRANTLPREPASTCTGTRVHGEKFRDSANLPVPRKCHGRKPPIAAKPKVPPEAVSTFNTIVTAPYSSAPRQDDPKTTAFKSLPEEASGAELGTPTRGAEPLYSMERTLRNSSVFVASEIGAFKDTKKVISQRFFEQSSNQDVSSLPGPSESATARNVSDYRRIFHTALPDDDALQKTSGTALPSPVGTFVQRSVLEEAKKQLKRVVVDEIKPEPKARGHGNAPGKASEECAGGLTLTSTLMESPERQTSAAQMLATTKGTKPSVPCARPLSYRPSNSLSDTASAAHVSEQKSFQQTVDAGPSSWATWQESARESVRSDPIKPLTVSTRPRRPLGVLSGKGRHVDMKRAAGGKLEANEEPIKGNKPAFKPNIIRPASPSLRQNCQQLVTIRQSSKKPPPRPRPPSSQALSEAAERKTTTTPSLAPVSPARSGQSEVRRDQPGTCSTDQWVHHTYQDSSAYKDSEVLQDSSSASELMYEVWYGYTAGRADELSVDPGDRLVQVGALDEHFIVALRPADQARGVVPRVVLRIIEHRANLGSRTSTENVSTAVSLHDFEGLEGELSFKKGELLTMVETVNDEWMRGKLENGKEGYFPATYVQTM